MMEWILLLKVNEINIKKSCRSGSILILVLIIVSAMTIIVFGLAYQTSIDVRLSGNHAQNVKLWYLVLSGIEAGKASLSERELTPERTAEVCRNNNVDESLKFLEQVELFGEDIELAYWIMDENALLDLNKSNSAIWGNLPNVTRAHVSCILDWIDSDSDVNPEGAESDYYERLEYPYICKDAPLTALKELLFIKDITREEYFGKLSVDVPITATAIRKHLDIIEQPPFVSVFTVHGSDRVNVNTVSSQILSAFPGLDAETADLIIAFRASQNDVVFESADCISKIERLTPLQKELLQEYVVYNSEMFRIYSFARIKEQVCLIMATVQVIQNETQLISIEKLL